MSWVPVVYRFDPTVMVVTSSVLLGYVGIRIVPPWVVHAFFLAVAVLGITSWVRALGMIADIRRYSIEARRFARGMHGLYDVALGFPRENPHTRPNEETRPGGGF